MGWRVAIVGARVFIVKAALTFAHFTSLVKIRRTAKSSTRTSILPSLNHVFLPSSVYNLVFFCKRMEKEKQYVFNELKFIAMFISFPFLITQLSRVSVGRKVTRRQ